MGAKVIAGKVGFSSLGTGFMVSNADDLKRTLEEEGPLSLAAAFQIFSVLGTVAGDLSTFISVLRFFQDRQLKNAWDILQSTENSGEKLEDVFKALEKVPVSVVKKFSRILEPISGEMADSAEALRRPLERVVNA